MFVCETSVTPPRELLDASAIEAIDINYNFEPALKNMDAAHDLLLSLGPLTTDEWQPQSQ